MDNVHVARDCNTVVYANGVGDSEPDRVGWVLKTKTLIF